MIITICSMARPRKKRDWGLPPKFPRRQKIISWANYLSPRNLHSEMQCTRHRILVDLKNGSFWGLLWPCGGHVLISSILQLLLQVKMQNNLLRPTLGQSWQTKGHILPSDHNGAILGHLNHLIRTLKNGDPRWAKVDLRNSSWICHSDSK